MCNSLSLSSSRSGAAGAIRLTLGLALVGFHAGAADAQSRTIPSIVVNAHQVPIDAARTGVSVTVLQGDALRARGITTVADALRDVPGVGVTQSGGVGSLTQARIRGSDANHVLVLVDNVPMNRLDAGDFDFANFGIESVERIEVLRGPQSGLFGSAAQAGVISITTKSGRGLTRPVIEGWAEYGSRETRAGAASFQGAQGSVYGAVTVQNMKTEGYNIARTGTENDGSRATSLTSKFGVNISPHFNIEGMYRVVDRNVQYDQEAFPFTDPPVFDSFAFDTFQTTTGSVAGTVRLLDNRWIQRVSWSNLKDEYSSDFGFGLASLFKTLGTRERAEYRSSYTFDTPFLGGARNTVSAQADGEQEHFENNFGADKSRERAGVTGEYLVDFPFGLTFSGAGRKDWNEDFADSETWRLAASQRFVETGTRLHASGGTGVTNPSFTEQFGTGFNFVGNPALRPEHSLGWDVGVEQVLFNGRLVVDTTYFTSDVTDQIVAGTNSAGQQTAVNVAGVSHRSGVETSATLSLFHWLTVAANYTYLDATRSDGTPEPRRPPHSAGASATVLFLDGRGRFTTTYRYNGDMEDRAFISTPGPTRVSLPAYSLISAKLSYDISPSATAYLRAENVFDKQYEEVYSYRAPSFAVYGGLRVKLGE